MPAPPLLNTFEGGSDGTAITTGNSGGASGDAFQDVNGSLIKFETDKAKFGTFSAFCNDWTGGPYLGWTGLGSLTVPVYIRYYVWLSAVPTTNHWTSVFFVTSGFTDAYYTLAFGTDGNLYDGAFAASAGAFSTGQWIRVEAKILPHISAGTSEYRLYNSPDADVNSWTGRQVRTGLNTGANIDIVRVGSNGLQPTLTAWIDQLAVSTTDWIGPVSVAGPKLYVLRSPYRLN